MEFELGDRLSDRGNDLAFGKSPCDGHAVKHEPSSGYEDFNLNYRVTWRSVDGSGESHERIFTSRDQGWDFCQDMRKSPRAMVRPGSTSLPSEFRHRLRRV